MSDYGRHVRHGKVRTASGLLVRLIVATVGCASIGWAAPILAQPAENAFASWKDVEASPQFKEVTTALRGGGAFNDAAREFLTAAILPQFERDDNLPTLDDVRKKIRERILFVIGNEESFTQASTFLRDRLDEMARDATRDPLLRVNAMLFVGEMTDKARIPWPPAVVTLAAAVQDAALDPAVRIAAVTGLGNHLAAIARLSGDQAKAVRNAVVTSLPAMLPSASDKQTAGVPSRSPATAWLATRGLGMLPAAATPATPDIAARLVALIADPTWPFDVRVRGAAALGKMVGAESGVTPENVLEAIRMLAVAALDGDRLEARRLLEMRTYKSGAGAAGGGVAGFMPSEMMPGMGGMTGEAPAEDGLGVAVCRRAAWRLYTLGDAIVPDSKKGGLIALLDKDGDKARQLATVLKDRASALDAEPYGYVLLEVLDELDPEGIKKRAAEAAPVGPTAPDEPAGPAPTDPAAPGKDKPAPKRPDSPFGDSPF